MDKLSKQEDKSAELKGTILQRMLKGHMVMRKEKNAARGWKTTGMDEGIMENQRKIMLEKGNVPLIYTG